MKLESIELRNAGRFTDTVKIGSLDDGLNILSARNESGKTTLLFAAARALFDRHNVSGEDIENLQPAGTSLAPDITVVFVTEQGRFKAHKTFLNSPASQLSEDRNGEWHPVADGDAADNKILELIGGERSGRGASKTKHWGMLRYLWARQGETASWPEWEGASGAHIRTNLAQVDIDPFVEQLSTQFEEEQEKQFTSTGKVSKNSELHNIQQEQENLETELTEIQKKMEVSEQQTKQLTQLREELNVKKKEHQDAKKQVDDFTEKKKKVELLLKDLERFENEHKTAQERLNEVDKAKKQIDKAQTELQKLGKELTNQETEKNRLQKETEKKKQELTDLQDKVKTQQKKLDITRKEETRLREIQELFGVEDDLQKLVKLQNKVHKQQKHLEQLQRKREALPDISKRQVTALEKQEKELNDLKIRAEAIGLSIGITPEQDVTITVNSDGQEKNENLKADNTTTVKAARSLHLTLPEWGELQIRSGAEEAAEIEQKISEKHSKLEKKLKDTGISSVEKARTIAEQLKDIDREIKTAEKRIQELLDDWDDPDLLDEEVKEIQADSEKRRVQLELNEDEKELTQTELKTTLDTQKTTIAAEEKELNMLREAVAEQNKTVESYNKKCDTAAEKFDEIRSRMNKLKTQAETIEERYQQQEGVIKAEEHAQTAFVEAKAKLEDARRKMPENWEKIDERYNRAMRAAEQASEEYQNIKQETQKLETLLEHTASEGLYSRAAKLEETLVNIKKEAKQIENRALAAKFLAGLIDYRKKAAVRTVLKPLEDQLSATFGEITGIGNRQVFLDEDLKVSGIGRKREETYPFEQLSQGAREQLLLALRAAVALELAKSGPQILILDDVLVNTDSTRQQNVLDFIENIAEKVQVLIVTCHAEQYRGVGNKLDFLSVPRS